MKEQRNSRLLLGILVIAILTLSFAVQLMSVSTTSIFVEPLIDVEGSPNKVFVLPLTFLNGALPPDKIGIGLLVASIIFVVLTKNKIQKAFNIIKRRSIFGRQYPGPPAFFVSLASLARTSVIVAIAEIVSSLIDISRATYNRYNVVKTTLKTVFIAISGELRTVSDTRNIHTFRAIF